MILIFSKEADISTNHVIEWLIFYNYDFIRLNADDILIDFNILISGKQQLDIELVFLKNGVKKKIIFSDITSVWYRRGGLFFENLKIELENIFLRKKLIKHVEYEWLTVKEFIFYSLRQKRSLGYYYHEHNNNKLINLYKAKLSGLDIPETIVSTQKKSISNFLKLHEEAITKNLKYHVKMVTETERIESFLTKNIYTKVINSYNDKIAPSLIQEKINKYLELRIFFIKNELFPMAIFSQQDEVTKLDYRNYNNDNPNRNVIFQLPEVIKSKLIKFIKLSGLDTGSIDIILTKENKYIFLEVNPVGQFGWVSHYCNFNIEQHIAKFLINEN